jgi:hypothetical protein
MRMSVRVALEKERLSLLRQEREAAEGEARLEGQPQPFHNGSPYPEVDGMVEVLGGLRRQWARHREQIRARITQIDARTSLGHRRE